MLYSLEEFLENTDSDYRVSSKGKIKTKGYEKNTIASKYINVITRIWIERLLINGIELQVEFRYSDDTNDSVFVELLYIW